MAVTRYCANCGLDRREGERFCRNCGAPLGTGETRPHETQDLSAGGEPTAPLRHTGPAPVLPPPPSAPNPIPSAVGVAAPGSAAPVPSAAARRSLPFKPVALAGGIALAVSAFLAWGQGADASDALDLPVELLWSLDATDGAVKIGFLLLAIGGLGAVLAFVPRTAWIRRICGGVGAAIVLAFVVTLVRLLDQAGLGLGELSDLVGPGAYVALAGAVALTASR